MPPAPGTSSCLAILVSSVTLMSLSVPSSTTGSGAGAAPARPPSRLPTLWARPGQPPGPWVRPPFPSLRRPRESCYRSPQFIHSFAARCRYRQGGCSKRCFQCLQVLHALGARQLVDLRGHDLVRARPVDSASLAASRSARRPGCLESIRIKVAEQRRARRVVLLGDARQLGGRVRAARVRIRSRADRRGRRPTARARQGRPPRDPIEVDQPRLAGRRARARDLRPAERVDQARLADIGAPASAIRGTSSRGMPSARAALVTKSALRSFNIGSRLGLSSQSTSASSGPECRSASREPRSGQLNA